MKTNIEHAIKLDLEFDAWKLQSDDRTEVIQLHLPPGAEQASHLNPVPVIFYLLEGSGILTVRNQEIEVAAGDLVQVEQGIMRSWKNKSDGILKLLVLKQLNSPEP